MAKSPELIAAVAGITGRDPVSIKVALRRLHEGGLIDVTGKGRGAKDMTSYDAACLLLGILGSRTLQDGPEAVVRYWQCRASTDSTLLAPRNEMFGGFFTRDLVTSLLTPGTFGRALAGLIRCAAHEAAFDHEWQEAQKGVGQPYLQVSVIGPRAAGRIEFGYEGHPLLNVGYDLPGPHQSTGYAETSQLRLDAIIEVGRVIGRTRAPDVEPENLLLAAGRQLDAVIEDTDLPPPRFGT